MIILVCNVGSTSLKFKLYDMPEARLLAVSGAERVGSDHDAIFRYERCADGGKVSFDKVDMPTYESGIRMFLDYLCSEQYGVIKDVKEIERVGYKATLSKGHFGIHELDEEVLQGMEDWSVIVMSSAESLIGKLILQRVLNEHRDKVLVCIETGGLDATICGKLGIAEPQTSGRPEEVFEQTIKWVAEHSDRKVYFPFTDSPLFKQFPDAMKACIYNEGLTMRYSTTPYDNIAVKIRNLEERYLTDYLKLSLQPYNEKRDCRLYRRFTPGMLALNYSAIYIDMLPYYQKHRPDRVEWLQNLYGACQAHYNVLSVGSFLNNEP